MTAPDSRAFDGRLDHAWDALVAGNAAGPIPIDDATGTALRRLHALPDAPPPERAFVARLERRLLEVDAATIEPLDGTVREPAKGRLAAFVRRVGRPAVRSWPLRELPTAALFVLMAAAGLGAVLLAQPGGEGETPRGFAVAGTPGGGLPAVPAPTECTVAPRSVEEVRSLAATARAGGVPTAASTWVGYAPLAGAESDEQAEPALVAVVRQLLACANAGDRLRWTALYSDQALSAVFGVGPFGWEPAPGAWQELATPSPLPAEERLSLVGVHAAQVLADGRVAALVVVGLPGGGEQQSVFVFVRTEEGRDLIDAIIDLPTGGRSPTPGTTGTPVATVTPVEGVLLTPPATPTSSQGSAQRVDRQAVELGVVVNRLGLLGGNAAEVAKARAALAEALAPYAGCRVAVGLTFAHDAGIEEARQLAEAVNDLLAAEFPDLFAGAALDAFADLDPPIGRVDLQLYFFEGCLPMRRPGATPAPGSPSTGRT